ncbi:MAG TPA: sigma-70 family RNA polymerase sigma factor [Blastocatellia bacterium]|nr:sigma-70 family RNA polymerase sigma factor [Blastocatellia bacterium]
MSSSDTGVTQLLMKWSEGDESALESLLPIIYDNLHRLARSYLRRERPDHTLQATALVNEAYLRLVDQNKIRWQNRAQFFGVAAQLMRRILVDHARAQRADKRGGEGIKLSLTAADRIARWRNVDLIALDDALKTLAEIDPQQSRIVELKFFGGLTIEETAEILGISHATVERDWSMARAWLRREIKKGDG